MGLNSNLAPIVLFIYSRPFHTKNLLDSLASNEEASESLLYIFCDGPKEGASDEVIRKIEETRLVAKTESRFQKVIIVENQENKGLANSIIHGVTEVVNSHGKIIVLEDDLVVSKYFLYYMNNSLDRYKTNESVGQIGACNFFACGDKYDETFFIPIPDCWGWATWKDRWEHFNPNAIELLDQLKQAKLEGKFNVYDSCDMIGMLKSQIEGRVSSWAIRWQAVCILNNWLTLYPNPSVSNHIESSEATHESSNITPPLCTSKPKLDTIAVLESDRVIKAMKRGYSMKGDYFGNIKEEYKVHPIKYLILAIVPRKVVAFWNKYRNSTISI